MVQIDVFSDVACPWCFIGERRLQRALQAAPQGSVQVRWRAFELQPDLPARGVEARPFFEQKFGSVQNMNEAFARVTQAGAPEGIAFDFSRIHAPNTRLAHRAIQLAAGSPAQHALVDACFRGHFEEGVDVANLDALLALFERHQVPLDLPLLRSQLERGEGEVQVAQDEAAAAQLGVRGVPFFIANGRYAMSGAQPLEHFQQLLAAAEHAPSP